MTFHSMSLPSTPTRLVLFLFSLYYRVSPVSSPYLYLLPTLTHMIHISTQEWFGVATGEMLHNFSQGLDSTQLESVPDRKSIGVEVNWGIRFTDKSKAMRFFTFVCAELAGRIDQVLYVSSSSSCLYAEQ